MAKCDVRYRLTNTMPERIALLPSPWSRFQLLTRDYSHGAVYTFRAKFSHLEEFHYAKHRVLEAVPPPEFSHNEQRKSTQMLPSDKRKVLGIKQVNHSNPSIQESMRIPRLRRLSLSYEALEALLQDTKNVGISSPISLCHVQPSQQIAPRWLLPQWTLFQQVPLPSDERSAVEM